MPSLRHFAVIFVVLLIITAADFVYLGAPRVGIDDANIFLNYARHIANGDGFVFNTGGERVEGSSSMLWVLIESLFFLVSPKPELLIMTVLFLFTVLTVALMYEEVRHDVMALNESFGRTYFPWVFGAFVVSLAPNFLAWSVLSLMENGFWTLVLLSNVLLILRLYRVGVLARGQKVCLLLAGAALMLTRPEGFVWGPLLAIALGLAEWRSLRRLRFALLYFAVLAGTATSLVLLRLDYFGYPLPNTYYAKVSTDAVDNLKAGGRYALKFLTVFHPVVSLAFAVLLIATLRACVQFGVTARLHEAFPERNPVVRIVVVFLVIGIGISLPLVSGGDHFGGYRFYQNILMLFCWSIPATLWLVQRRPSACRIERALSLPTALFLSVALISVGTLLTIARPDHTEFVNEFRIASSNRRAADEMNRFWPEPRPSIGVLAAGGFGYVYQGETVDLMGLNNTLMGHSKGARVGIKNHAAFDKDVFYKLMPDVIVPRFVSGKTEATGLYFAKLNKGDFENIALKSILNDPQFQRVYHPVLFVRSGFPSIFAFTSDEYLAKARKDPGVTILLLGS